jgi:uncharacterized protein involved in exopolysaccharide biosynthesis
VAKTSAPDKGFDPEAEQEVDFARYGRMLARRWWLVAVGVVAGAVIGYLISLGGKQLYSATTTIYLGQPYNGTTPLINLQTNPSAVSSIASAQAVDAKVAKQCTTSVKSFHKGISVQKVGSSTAAKGLAAQVNPLVTLTVQAPKGKAAACVANALADASVTGIAGYPLAKIKNLEARIASDNAAIKANNALVDEPGLSDALRTNALSKLNTAQTDLSTSGLALIVAKTVEMPKVTVRARTRQVSAQSSRNTVIIAALIGLILGVIGALLWDRLVPRQSSRNGS